MSPAAGGNWYRPSRVFVRPGERFGLAWCSGDYFRLLGTLDSTTAWVRWNFKVAPLPGPGWRDGENADSILVSLAPQTFKVLIQADVKRVPDWPEVTFILDPQGVVREFREGRVMNMSGDSH